MSNVSINTNKSLPFRGLQAVNSGSTQISTGTTGSSGATAQVQLGSPHTDTVQISAKASNGNSSFANVKVDAWGQGSNDHLVGILQNQGYTSDEIYGGLLNQVSASNNLKNPNLIQAGATLKIPVKAKAESTAGASTAPTSGTPLSQLSNEQLITGAKDLRAGAVEDLGAMFGSIDGLPDGELKNNVRRGMTYQVAADSGLFMNGDQSMTPEQIQTKMKDQGPEAKQEFQNQVGNWIAENPLMGQMSMANGAALAAYSGFSEDLPNSTKQSLLGIAQNGNASVEKNMQAVDNSHELFQRNSEQGKALFAKLDNM